MARPKKPKVDKNDLGANPFLTSFILPMKKNIGRGFERDDDVWLNSTYIMEARPFTKLYNTAELRDVTILLSASAKTLLFWVLYNVEEGADHIWINKKYFMEKSKITSINTYKSALTELIRYGYLCYTVVGDVFWLNPEFFFNGNPAKRYEKNIKIVYEYESANIKNRDNKKEPEPGMGSGEK